MAKSDLYYKQDTLKSGQPFVELGYKAKNSHSIKVAVKHGCNMFSYIINGNETLYYDDKLPLTSFAVGNPILFPFPNRITDAMYTWKGVTRLQKKHGIPIQLHSLVYDETTFTHDEPVVTKEAVTLTTRLRVDEDHAIYRGYPFAFMLEIKFIITPNGLSIAYIINNLSDDDMPYGVGYHPYFNKLSGQDETEICVPCRYMYQVDNEADAEFFNKVPDGLGMTGNVLPTGNLQDVAGTAYDINTKTPVGKLNVDTVYTNLAQNPVATIDYKTLGLTVQISGCSDFKHYVVFTPAGAPYFCIEPQTCSTDAVNLHNKGVEHVNLLVCKAKQEKKGTVHINYACNK